MFKRWSWEEFCELRSAYDWYMLWFKVACSVNHVYYGYWIIRCNGFGSVVRVKVWLIMVVFSEFICVNSYLIEMYVYCSLAFEFIYKKKCLVVVVCLRLMWSIKIGYI